MLGLNEYISACVRHKAVSRIVEAGRNGGGRKTSIQFVQLETKMIANNSAGLKTFKNKIIIYYGVIYMIKRLFTNYNNNNIVNLYM